MLSGSAKIEGVGVCDDRPAVVPADAPHADACDWLRVEHTAVHGVNEVQHIILQQQVHVLALNEHTERHIYYSSQQKHTTVFSRSSGLYQNSHPLKAKC